MTQWPTMLGRKTSRHAVLCSVLRLLRVLSRGSIVPLGPGLSRTYHAMAGYPRCGSDVTLGRQYLDGESSPFLGHKLWPRSTGAIQ